MYKTLRYWDSKLKAYRHYVIREQTETSAAIIASELQLTKKQAVTIRDIYNDNVRKNNEK